VSQHITRHVVASLRADIEVVLTAAPTATQTAVLLVHGYGGSAAALMPLAEQFSLNGYDTAAMSMRGFGGSTGADDLGIDQPRDVVAVAAWLRARNEYRRVFAVGISQGGQVVLLAASQGAPLDAVAAWAPVTDVKRWRETTSNAGVRDYVDNQCADGRYAERSPLCVAARINVPVLLVHGDADTRVPTEQSILLHQSLVAEGHASTLELLAGVGHRHRDQPNRPNSLDLSLSFFDSIDTATTS
jgi:ABC-2 type transport system ATP-binding protein